MFYKNIAADSIQSGNDKIIRKIPDWAEYLDKFGTKHIQMGLYHYWDEIQLKYLNADRQWHIVINAYQGKDIIREIQEENINGEIVTVKKYPLTNLIADGNQEMLDEFICVLDRNPLKYLNADWQWYTFLNAFQEKDRAEIIAEGNPFLSMISRNPDPWPMKYIAVLMNLYGQQTWPNAHFHLFYGPRKRKNNFWTAINELKKARRAGRLGFFRKDLEKYKHTVLVGTRNNPELAEEILAIDITDAVSTGSWFSYENLVNVIEELTAQLQKGISLKNCRKTGQMGFDGYGSLVFLLDNGIKIYYLIREHN